jgi:hypothetical protein
MSGAEPSREELLHKAQQLGIEHPENMTRIELVRAIAQYEVGTPPKAPTRAASWLEIARQLLAAVVEQGLNMPDAAALIRGDTKLSEPPKQQPPLATVTLAKIYAAQGHVARALSVLAEVLKTEPDHQAAIALQNQIKDKPNVDVPRRKGPPPAPASAASTLEALAAVAKAVRRPGSVQTDATTESPSAATEPVVHAVPAIHDGPVESAEPQRTAGGEHDALVLLVRDGSPQMLGWELAETTEAARAAGIAVEIEWTTFTPSWQGPVRQLVRIPVPRAFGRMSLPKVAPATLVHGVLGLRQGSKLVPLATLMVAERASDSEDAPRISRGRAAGHAMAADLALRVWASVPG